MNANEIKRGGREIEPDLIKVSELARCLSISRSLAYQLIRSGEIPSCRLTDKAIRVSRLALAAWLAERAA